MRLSISSLLSVVTVVAVFLYPTLSQALTFTDDFNRPDSTTVGNGWSNPGGNLEILNNELTCRTGTGDDGAGILRPFAFTAPLTVTAKIKEMNGFGSLLRRYVAGFWVRNNGALRQGYGVTVIRSDQNFNNSAVILNEGNTQVSILPSSFQYGPELRVSITFNPDGSVTGTVSEPAPSTNTFSFSFPPRQIQSVGDNFSISTSCANPGATVFPRFDDVMISDQAPSSCAAELPFRWPTAGADGLMGQDYAAFNGGPERWRNHYHTGIDIRARQSTNDGPRINEDVFAVATGEVEAVCPNGVENGNGEKGCFFGVTQFSTKPDNHGLDGVVILKHFLPTGEIVHSLYGHLDNVETFKPSECVSQGTKLGVTGARSDKHLHFEIKSQPVLHNPIEERISCTNRNSGKSFSMCWGYTLNHPNNYGYYDPLEFFHSLANTGFPRLVEITGLPGKGAKPEIKVGPGSFSSITYRKITDNPRLGEYEAISKAPGTSAPDCPSGWYQIRDKDFDCSRRNNCFNEEGARAGSRVPDGWICSIFVID